MTFEALLPILHRDGRATAKAPSKRDAVVVPVTIPDFKGRPTVVLAARVNCEGGVSRVEANDLGHAVTEALALRIDIGADKFVASACYK